MEGNITSKDIREIPLFSLLGMPILANPFLMDKRLKRMCKSKKKRIIKKWLKNEKNYINVPSNSLFMINNNMYVHPEKLVLIKSIGA